MVPRGLSQRRQTLHGRRSRVHSTHDRKEPRMTRMTRIFFTVFLLVAFVQAQDVTVQVDKPGAPVPKTLFGLFFEDINFGADGGLYPERVKNRSFEFPNPMMGWTAVD